MKQITILSAHMENFKKFKEKNIEFGKKTTIYGKNTSGKSSVADIFSWVMFNKSSTGNTEGKHFRPRRYDENGVKIDYVDVVGELVLLIDGERVKIRKVQRQEWVRHKGDDFDSYTGDKTLYEWNEVPVAATQHKKKVEEIIGEDIFRMLSNPAAFPAMEAKKQRDFLLKNIANITDTDVFASNPEFEFVKEAIGKGTLDDLLAKNKKEIAGYEQKKLEIPVRIDQESKRIEDIDFKDTEEKLAILEQNMRGIECCYEETGKAYEVLSKKLAEKHTLELELSKIENAVQKEYRDKIRAVRSLKEQADDEFTESHNKQTKLESAHQIKTITIQNKEEELDRLRKKFTEEVAKEMNTDELFCPTCGQELPEDQADEVRKNFEENKASAIREINYSGKLLSNEIKHLKEEIAAYETEIEVLKQKKIKAMGESNKHMSLLDDYEKNPADPSENNDWKETKAKIEALGAEIDAISTTEADSMREKIKAERADVQRQMDALKEKLALKTVIENSKAMVKELEEEMVEVVQKLANCEKLDKAIEKFNRTKMSMLSERINDKFKLVTWKLFEKQKNQRYAEVCVCQIHGSDYGENTTSATERMMAGMDIIRTLQEIYQVHVPIFLDDADLYNDWNIPDMDCQLIKLCVSEDEELRIEREE